MLPIVTLSYYTQFPPPALMDRQIVTSIRNHVRPKERGNPGQVLVLNLSGCRVSLMNAAAAFPGGMYL